jgi:WD40 repeat protein
MGICSAYNKSTSLLAIGDTRGNLALFDLRTKDSDLDGMIVGPVSVVPKAHGKEHITDMIWKDDCTLLSVGNDACILESSIGEDGTLSTLLSVTVSSFSALTHIWSLTSKDNSITAAVILAGYFGNRFAVIDYNTGYEFCGVETGGRQRPLEVYQARAAIFSFPKETIMAIGHTVENGRNELILHNFGVHGIPAARHMSFPRHSWGFPLHGESIFDITFVQLGKMQSTFALISGSEDCSSIVSLIHKGVALSRKMLPPDVSGIRAVCSNQLISGETFLAIGGKLTLQFFVVELVDTNNDLECKIRHLGKGAPPKKPTIDHRLNSIVAFPIKEDDGVMVASGDSDGCCYLYIVSASCTGRLLHRTDYPILCLYSIKFAELRLLLMGTTSGEVMVFIAPQTSNDLDSLVATTDPIMRYKAHSMGTNAICAIQHRSPGNIDNFLRICTAGDDQAICCGDIQINYGEAFVTAQASVLRLLWAKDASMSAFKGIEMIDEDRFVVSGHDQRLSLWQVEDDAKMNHLLSEPVDIGDINSFSMCKSHDGQYFIGVAGAGVELFTLKV